MPKPFGTALAILLVVAGALLYLLAVANLTASSGSSASGLTPQSLASPSLVLFAAGTGAMCAAYRVWRGSRTAAIYGGIGLVVLVLLLAFFYGAVAPGLRH